MPPVACRLFQLGAILVVGWSGATRAEEAEDFVPIDVLMDRPLPGPLVQIDPTVRGPFLIEDAELKCFFAEETRASIWAYEQLRNSMVSPPRLPGWGVQYGFAPRAFEGW